MRIGLDIDGVLAQFDKAFLERINELYLTSFTLEDLKLKTTWNFYKHVPGLTKKMEDGSITNLGEWFWLTLDPFDKKVMLALAVLAEKHNIYFITDRAPNPTAEMSLWQSRRWIEQFGIKPAGVILTSDKSGACNLLNIDYFIDDRSENVISINNN